MSEPHTVTEGDCIWSLAQEHKISWKKVWDAPGNADLRLKRGNPFCLAPGDIVVVPEVEPKKVALGPDTKLRLIVKRKVEVRVVLRGHDHERLDGVEYFFSIDDEPCEKKTTGTDGEAFENIPPEAESIVLHTPWGEFPVRLGVLVPANTITGIQQRLVNLGFNPGLVDGKLGTRTRAAITVFQKAESGAGLEPTGEPCEKTVNRLRELHDDFLFTANVIEDEPEEAIESVPDELADARGDAIEALIERMDYQDVGQFEIFETEEEAKG